MPQMPTSIQPLCSTTNQRDGLEACALFLSHHEGDDPSEIGPERQKLQVEHALEVVFENGWHSLRLLQDGELHVDLLLGPLNAPLDAPLNAPPDVTDGLGILTHEGAIFRPYSGVAGPPSFSLTLSSMHCTIQGCSGGGSLHEGALASASAFKLWCFAKGCFHGAHEARGHGSRVSNPRLRSFTGA